ncbi:Transcription initiation factor IIA large subunit [Cucumispora dikerogammari]|nr:Transcription initiation factor IIA large subunit [Cucumispora dikerogammari]
MDTRTLTAYVDTIDELTKLVLESNIVDPETMTEISYSWTANLKEILTDSSKLIELSSESNSDDSETNNKTINFMMCLYEKINKIKGKWKCFFKRGYVNINNRDYVFSTAFGDLEW